MLLRVHCSCRTHCSYRTAFLGGCSSDVASDSGLRCSEESCLQKSSMCARTQFDKHARRLMNMFFYALGGMLTDYYSVSQVLVQFGDRHCQDPSLLPRHHRRWKHKTTALFIKGEVLSSDE